MQKENNAYDICVTGANSKLLYHLRPFLVARNLKVVYVGRNYEHREEGLSTYCDYKFLLNSSSWRISNWLHLAVVNSRSKLSYHDFYCGNVELLKFCIDLPPLKNSFLIYLDSIYSHFSPQSNYGVSKREARQFVLASKPSSCVFVLPRVVRYYRLWKPFRGVIPFVTTEALCEAIMHAFDTRRTGLHPLCEPRTGHVLESSIAMLSDYLLSLAAGKSAVYASWLGRDAIFSSDECSEFWRKNYSLYSSTLLDKLLLSGANENE